MNNTRSLEEEILTCIGREIRNIVIEDDEVYVILTDDTAFSVGQDENGNMFLNRYAHEDRLHGLN